MRGKSQPVVLLWALLVLTGIGSGGLPARSEEIPGPVPAPSAVAQITVGAGKVYPFPWSGVNACLRSFQPGCFVVKAIGPERVVLAYARFELDGRSLKPQGFRYLTPVTPDGSGYELFPIKLGGGREEWVYAVLEQADAGAGVVRFLKLPAFVTDKARVAVLLDVEMVKGRLQEFCTVETLHPITLIGLGDLRRVLPSARLEAIEVNGGRVILPYPGIVHLNLPAGSHRVAMRVGFGIPPTELTIQGTLLEPRKMSLIETLDLRVDLGPHGSGAEMEVRTVGLPPEVWDRFRSTLAVAPAPVGEELNPLAIRYRFGPSRDLTLRARPRVPLGPNNYPVMITVKAPVRH